MSNLATEVEGLVVPAAHEVMGWIIRKVLGGDELHRALLWLEREATPAEEPAAVDEPVPAEPVAPADEPVTEPAF